MAAALPPDRETSGKIGLIEVITAASPLQSSERRQTLLSCERSVAQGATLQGNTTTT